MKRIQLLTFLLAIMSSSLLFGQTSDVSTFQQLKDACNDSSIKTVRVIGGNTINITGTLVVNGYKEITVTGTGDATIKGYSSCLRMFNIALRSKFIINGLDRLTIDGDGCTMIIDANQAWYMEINNTTLKNAKALVKDVRGVNDTTVHPLSEFILKNSTLEDFYEKGVVINRMGPTSPYVAEYTVLGNYEITGNTFRITTSAHSKITNASKVRAVSLDAGNDGPGGIGPNVAYPSNDYCLIDDNDFYDCGVAVARYSNVQIGSTVGNNFYAYDNGRFDNATYNLVHLENNSENINVENNIFRIYTASVRQMFIGTGSEWINDSDDHLYPVKNVLFKNNKLWGSGTVLDYIYSNGIQGLTVTNNYFHNRTSANVPMSFDMTKTNEIVNNNIVINNNDEIYTKQVCGYSWKVHLRTDTCGSNNVNLSDTYKYVGTSTLAGKCHRDAQCSNNNRVALAEELNDKINAFELYPNPLLGNELTVQLKEWDKPAFVTVVSSTGKIVIAKQLMGQRKNKVSFSNLPKGIYFVQLEQGENTLKQKILN